jgi:hypothetical protein
MKAVEYPHQAFLKKNNIDVEKLPKLIKQRIAGFDEIHEDLPYLVEEDQRVIEETLQRLSFEIEEDLEEEFEGELENNEIEEELIEVGNEEESMQDQAEPKEPEGEIGEETETAPKPATPEERLKEVFEEGKDILYPSELKEFGIPIPKERKVTIGNFCLTKGRYKNCYTLTLRREKVKEK